MISSPELRIVVAGRLARDQRIEAGSFVGVEARDQVFDEGPAPAVGHRPERSDQDETLDTFRVGDGDVHREVAAPVVADQPGTVPVEEVEQGDLVGHVGLDVARTARWCSGRGRAAAGGCLDGVDELVEQAEDRLGAETRAAVEEERPRA